MVDAVSGTTCRTCGGRLVSDGERYTCEDCGETYEILDMYLP